MSSDATSGHGPAPMDDVPDGGSAADAGSGDFWSDGVSDALGDAVATNWFSDEIENVNASDWEVDAAQIWDDDGDAAGDADGGLGLDFSL
jgi:hypothetical protein